MHSTLSLMLVLDTLPPSLSLYQSPGGASTHTHTIACSTPPSTIWILLLPLPPPPLPWTTPPSISQVVHCRVCTPHPLHAPLLVLHLAGYPARPTQGRMVLIDSATCPDGVCHSLQYLMTQGSEAYFLYISVLCCYAFVSKCHIVGAVF